MKCNNIIFGFRSIRKGGIYSIINIAGISIGIAVVTLILFWVVDELNFDKFHENLDQVYTIYEHQVYSEGQDLFTYCTPFPMSQELIKNYPEVKNATTFAEVWNQLLKYGDKEYKEGPIYCVDNEFLKIFSFRIIEGDRNALESPDKMIINEDIARLYFGKEPAIGKMLKINDTLSYTVGAVMANQKENSTLNFKILLPIDFMKQFGADMTNWGSNWPRTSVLMAQGTDINSFATKIATLCKDKGQQESTMLHIFPFGKERLYTYSGKNNRIQYVYQFLGIAFIIILIASINFINLSTAKAEQQRREIGIRKVLGAGREDIFKQFIIEKGLMILFSLIISSMLVLLFLPVFNAVSDKHITTDFLQNPYMILVLLLAILLITFISVIYPSLFLSSSIPANAIKKTTSSKIAGDHLKNLLVVIQFTLSVILIAGSIFISKQIRFINNYNLGYNQSSLVYLFLNGEGKNKYDAIIQELKHVPGVENISLTNNLPFYGTSSSWGYDWEGKNPETKLLMSEIKVDRNFFATMGIDFIEGTTFSNRYDRVKKSEEISAPEVILNKEAIRRMEMDNPVGKSFGTPNDIKATIKGVVNDFHFQSLYRSVEPLLISPLNYIPDNIIIRINPVNFSRTIEDIKKTWNKVLPQSMCEIGFFDESLKKLYQSEMRISGLFKYFSFIAIFISCIGLFGLSLFIIERRTKEIGIRKVNGARIFEVLAMLNKDFIKWVIIAFVIACPIAWYVMNIWLQNFAYKTKLSWWVFATAGAIAVLVALLTVSWQSWKAATRNPVEALRYE
jgi:ABC-type antimicrobial peptide transport system permease subunit